MIKKSVSILICVPLALSVLPNISVNYAHGEEYYPIDADAVNVISYSAYYDIYGGEARPDSEIFVNGADFTSNADGNFSVGEFGSDGDIRENVLVWDSPRGTVTYDIDVPETSIYCLDLSYFPIGSELTETELSLAVDGNIPYDTASRLTLNRMCVNEREIYEDMRGNQVRPTQIQKNMWLEAYVGDPDGLFDDPLIFYLTEGSHEITLSSERAEIALEYLKFTTPKKIPTYEEYKNNINAEFSGGSDIIRIEGENALYKSASSLAPSSDGSNYLTSPSDPVKLKYNTIGGDNWKKALQAVTWEIPADEINGGWYRIGIKYRQNQMRGFSSNRRIYIDGEVLCSELDCVKFGYGSGWDMKIPQNENGEEIYIYLDGQTSHTITMECICGEIGEYLRRLEDCTDRLDDCYRSIIMITGPNPDKYTDYYVHEKVPKLLDELADISAELKDIQKGIESISDSSGSEASVLDNTSVILDKCVKKPLKIPEYLKQIKNSLTSVSAWIRDYRDQPLEIDYIELAQQNTDFSQYKANFGKSLMFAFKSFFGSFFEDYTTLSDISDGEAIEVWVSLGREQAQIIKEMTENEFIPEYDIPVSVNLVTGGIVEASLAGKGPDVALFLGGEFPVNLASRGMLADVSQFEEYDEITQRFQKNAMTPYQYNGGAYGLPISQTFPMMFYRTDILTELGFTSPPETWQELIDMLPAIQRNYMNAGLVLPAMNVSPATETGHTFALLMLQSGQNYYNDTLTSSTLSTADSVQAFEMWTDFYKKYSFEQTYDKFSRFRTGEYPIVIAEYTFFNQLTVSAPEIDGAWDFCPVPGTMRADGTISHSANSTGSGAVIFNKTENKSGAWEYIKWFTSAEVQAEFANRTEGLLGTLGRFDTANVQALSMLSWSPSELERLYAQQAELVEIPVIPASYAVTRNIMNAFRETVNEGQEPRDTIIWYDRDINEELRRKAKELSK